MRYLCKSHALLGTYDSCCENVVQRISWMLCILEHYLGHTTLGILCGILVELLPRDAYAEYGSDVIRTNVYERVYACMKESKRV